MNSGEVFGCNNVHSLLLISRTTIDNKKYSFKNVTFRCFLKIIKANDNFFF